MPTRRNISCTYSSGFETFNRPPSPPSSFAFVILLFKCNILFITCERVRVYEPPPPLRNQPINKYRSRGSRLVAWPPICPLRRARARRTYQTVFIPVALRAQHLTISHCPSFSLFICFSYHHRTTARVELARSFSHPPTGLPPPLCYYNIYM